MCVCDILTICSSIPWETYTNKCACVLQSSNSTFYFDFFDRSCDFFFLCTHWWCTHVLWIHLMERTKKSLFHCWRTEHSHKNQMLKWNDRFYLMIVSHTFGHRCCAHYALQWNRSTTLIKKNETLTCTQNKCQPTSQAPLVPIYHRYVLVRVPNLMRALKRSTQAQACMCVHVHVNFT